ncbi:rod shape-determining protein RodA [Enterovibrio norvegicus FF-33]|uniref:Rod shape-determining protein RodA n=1 Tax=Enterovibrio norvegicus FF-454 TaxID=1185651 RepID=A0A1E5C5X3_9GAMM|nr:DUF4399 domain-containing protein [Enterovibrio norvegicus]OEE60847.1 rod shape-determining protein RodA [Enterovibrio norvegicus FF-454]OEE67382.1 rod shape-determining protein RodA [Enterovibrio norvegicus FF-33]OEE86540.1 rod shape-determining protein RodA [Enterovibrio norvegicus FF-162]
MKHALLSSLLLVTASLLPSSLLAATPSAAGADVYFVQPKDGETVPETFKVVFGLKGMDVAPAGDNQPNSGHHHLLIDVDSLVDFALPLPANDNVKHFGGGQTETLLTLPKGKHTLQLLLADFVHIPHDKPVLSQKITINVQ